jgi:hypothetical protein
MSRPKDTGFLRNLVTYDSSGNITLPNNLIIFTNKNVATQEYVNTQITNLVNGAPAVLDTLKELADAIGGDGSFITNINASIAGKEPTIAAGTTLQYWRGDKSWQTLPIYTLSGLGGVPTSRTITINGTVLDLTSDRSWTINSMVYPTAGIALSTGTAWGTSVTNNSGNWNTAYTWGDHALGGYVTLSSTQTITGNKTFSGQNYFSGGTYFTYTTTFTKGMSFAWGGNSYTAGYLTLSSSHLGSTSSLIINDGDTQKAITLSFLNTVNTDRDYTFPNASGTIALTSDLTGFENASNKSTSTSLGSSNTLYPSQLAVKTYVDNATTGGINIQGDWNANTNSPNISTTTTTGFTWRVSVAGTTALGGISVWNVNDLAVKTAAGWIKIDNSSTVQSVFGRQGLVVAANGDYTTAQVTEDASYLYFTTARARAAFSAGANITITAGAIAASYPVFTGATSVANGVAGLVTQPLIANRAQYLKGDGTWGTPTDTIYSLPTATDTILGGVKVDGTTITITAGGVISGANTYSLPTASASVLGGIKVGTNLSITGGVLSSTDTNTWNANSKDVAGYVAAPGEIANKVWKTNATGDPAWRDDADTIYSLPTASDTVLGGIKVGAGLSIASGVLSAPYSYSLPTATDTVLGGIKVGSGLAIASGVLSATYSYTFPYTVTAAATANTIAYRDASANLTANAFYQTSSKSLKTCIEDYKDSATDIILKTNIVSFYFKNDLENIKIGFIAEDTPIELSTKNQNVMDANSAIGILLKAVQELESRIKELENGKN